MDAHSSAFRSIPVIIRTVDPDQLASEEAIWSGSALLSMQLQKQLYSLKIMQLNWLEKIEVKMTWLIQQDKGEPLMRQSQQKSSAFLVSLKC